MTEPPLVVLNAYDLTLWLIPKIENLPRSYRFTIGDRMVNTTLDLLMTLVTAAYRREKVSTVRAASAKLNGLRYLLRLSKDLHWLSAEGYHHASEQVDEIGRLYEAARRAALGKRRRPDVAAFLLDLEGEVCALRRELESETYQPGEYRTFVVREPKRRLISAAPFRDRVVHHALTQVLEPIFERRFSPHSYACRTGMGAHKALAGARQAAARYL